MVFHVSKTFGYVRRLVLEGSDSNLIIIDLEGAMNTRLINVYRSFLPQNGVSQRENLNTNFHSLRKPIVIFKQSYPPYMAQYYIRHI